MRKNKLIQLYITNMCNSHCKTCSIWKNKEREELSLDDIKKVIESYPDADFVIGGGEAILHSQINAILLYLQKSGVNYTLLSNCISFHKLAHVIKLFKVPNVTISCDGINHDEIRGSKGNLENIKRFIKWANAEGVSFKISYTLSSYNQSCFKEDMQMFNDLGIDKIYFCLAQNMELLHTGTDSVVADYNVVKERMDMLLDKDRRFVEMLIDDNGREKCDSQTSVFTIYSSGDVVRCQSYLSNDIIGNVKVNDIKDIIDDAKSIDCPYDGKCNLVCQRRYD